MLWNLEVSLIGHEENFLKVIKPLLILDLDETLIYATKKPLKRLHNFRVSDYYVYERPRMKSFLIDMSESYKLAIWSSAGDDYVKEIAGNIKPENVEFEFIWSRNKAVFRRSIKRNEGLTYVVDHDDHFQYVKPLKKVKKLGFELERILIVDDSPHKATENYGNAIYPLPFKGSKDDNELKLLGRYLMEIKDRPNFRLFEKRGWKKKTRNHS